MFALGYLRGGIARRLILLQKHCGDFGNQFPVHSGRMRYRGKLALMLLL
jgi:hypothetical protein